MKRARRQHGTWQAWVWAWTLAVLAQLGLAAPASAQVRAARSELVAAHSGKCIDVSGVSPAPLAALVQYPCHGGGNELWSLLPVNGAFRLVVAHSGLCAAVANDALAPGAAVVQYPCNGSEGQQWQARAEGDGWQLVSVRSGLCLGVENGQLRDFTPLVQRPCGAAPGNLFHVRAGWLAPGAPSALAVRHSGQCLTAGAAVGGAVQAACNGGAEQQWRLLGAGEAWQLAGADGACLAAGAGRALARAPCDASAASQWRPLPGARQYQLVNGASGLCLAIDGGGEGAAAVQQDCDAGAAWQGWTLAAPALAASWGPVLPLPLVPVAAANLPDGRILAWSGYSAFNWGVENQYAQTASAVFDPASGSAELYMVSETGHEMFCPGVSMLADGRVLVSGGSSSSKTSAYDPARGWSGEAPMRIPRGYQSNVTLDGGAVLTLGGSWSGTRGGKSGELWRNGGDWSPRPGIPDEPVTADDPAGVFRGDNHLWLFARAGGSVFHAGPGPAMHWIDTAGAGAIASAGARGDAPYSMNGNAVLVGPDTILTLGGAPAYTDAWASKRAHLIELGGGQARVRPSAPMQFARTLHNSALLPNGQLVVTGGQAFALLFSDERALLVPELWDPATELFARLAPMDVARTYHSISLLLADGRVLVGGGGLCGDCTANHADVQILTPPYLLRADGSAAARPAIVAASARVAPGARLLAEVDAPVAAFALMRLSSVTHSVNTDQRRTLLVPYSDDARHYSMTLPPRNGELIPGNYMLFALSPAGVPSVSVTVRVEP